MKRIAYFLTMALALPLFVACSDDTEEILEPEVQKLVKGTDTRDNDDRPYWWYWPESYKIYFTYLDTKAFIYYHPSNREVIVEKLAERGLKLEDDYDYSLGFYPNVITNKGENLYFLAECVWNEVSASYKDIIDIPEILGACPNIQGQYGASRGTCGIYINTRNNETLLKIAEEYKVHIVGTLEYDHFFTSFVWCDKNSKGNAYEIARDLWEKDHIGAEPAGWVEPC